MYPAFPFLSLFPSSLNFGTFIELQFSFQNPLLLFFNSSYALNTVSKVLCPPAKEYISTRGF